MDIHSDMELFDLAISGDEYAFQDLVQRHYLNVYRLSFKWCSVKEDAEDITQEVFIKFARKLKTFNRKSSLKTWLFRITINTVKDYVRKNSTKKFYEAAYADEHARNNPGPSQESSIDTSRLYEAIDRLPDKQRAALLLVMAEGLSHKEAAYALNCSETTVSWRIHEARKGLRKILPGWYDNE